MNRSRIPGFLGLVLVIAVSGCEKRVSIRAVEPAREEITLVKRIAVIDLAYAERPEVGRNIANVIVAELDQAGTFEVMERIAVKKVLDEQAFSAAGITDVATASSIGKLLGVDGMIVGEVFVYDAGNQALGKYASVGINVRMVDVRSAKVIFSDSILKDYTKFLDEKRKNVALNQLSVEVAQEFAHKIAPHFVDREKILLTTGGDVGETNNRGIKFASNRLWDKALEQFLMAVKLEPENAKVHNNLGVCYEHFGQLDKAVESYETAIRLDPDDDGIQKNLAGLRDTFRSPTRSAKDVLDSQKQPQGDKTPHTAPAPQ